MRPSLAGLQDALLGRPRRRCGRSSPPRGRGPYLDKVNGLNGPGKLGSSFGLGAGPPAEPRRAGRGAGSPDLSHRDPLGPPRPPPSDPSRPRRKCGKLLQSSDCAVTTHSGGECGAPRGEGEWRDVQRAGVPREAFLPGNLAFPQISAPASAPHPLLSPSKEGRIGGNAINAPPSIVQRGRYKSSRGPHRPPFRPPSPRLRPRPP